MNYWIWKLFHISHPKIPTFFPEEKKINSVIFCESAVGRCHGAPSMDFARLLWHCSALLRQRALGIHLGLRRCCCVLGGDLYIPPQKNIHILQDKGFIWRKRKYNTVHDTMYTLKNERKTTRNQWEWSTLQQHHQLPSVWSRKSHTKEDNMDIPVPETTWFFQDMIHRKWRKPTMEFGNPPGQKSCFTTRILMSMSRIDGLRAPRITT